MISSLSALSARNNGAFFVAQMMTNGTIKNSTILELHVKWHGLYQIQTLEVLGL